MIRHFWRDFLKSENCPDRFSDKNRIRLLTSDLPFAAISERKVTFIYNGGFYGEGYKGKNTGGGTGDVFAKEPMPDSLQALTAYLWQKWFPTEGIILQHFDMQIGAAHSLTVCAGEDEKLHIDLASGEMENIGSLFKVKLDENRGKLDVDCMKKDDVSRYEAADTLSVAISLPKGLTGRCEIAASVSELRLMNLALDRLEFDGDAQSVTVSDCRGSIELTSRTGQDVTVDGICGALDIHLWKAGSIVHIPENADFRVQNKGRGCHVYFQKNGEAVETGGRESSENLLSLSGIQSELIVDLQ